MTEQQADQAPAPEVDELEDAPPVAVAERTLVHDLMTVCIDELKASTGPWAKLSQTSQDSAIARIETRCRAAAIAAAGIIASRELQAIPGNLEQITAKKGIKAVVVLPKDGHGQLLDLVERTDGGRVLIVLANLDEWAEQAHRHRSEPPQAQLELEVPGDQAQLDQAAAGLEPDWTRDDAGTVGVLELVQVAITVEALEPRTDAEVQAAEEWAAAVHYRAGDNDVPIPVFPAWLRPFYTGQGEPPSDIPADGATLDEQLAGQRDDDAPAPAEDELELDRKAELVQLQTDLARETVTMTIEELDQLSDDDLEAIVDWLETPPAKRKGLPAVLRVKVGTQTVAITSGAAQATPRPGPTPKPDPKPETSQAAAQEPARRGPGRPPGAKNKPKGPPPESGVSPGPGPTPGAQTIRRIEPEPGKVRKLGALD